MRVHASRIDRLHEGAYDGAHRPRGARAPFNRPSGLARPICPKRLTATQLVLASIRGATAAGQSQVLPRGSQVPPRSQSTVSVSTNYGDAFVPRPLNCFFRRAPVPSLTRKLTERRYGKVRSPVDTRTMLEFRCGQHRSCSTWSRSARQNLTVAHRSGKLAPWPVRAPGSAGFPHLSSRNSYFSRVDDTPCRRCAPELLEVCCKGVNLVRGR